ncbi:MAG: gliding motility-associated C-terminal domain-containing protein [Elusimicrobiota bacterium]|nr:gliding motility-associated C-terminal domain-containing protein [Elusimicrobiota bacterium]
MNVWIKNRDVNKNKPHGNAAATNKKTRLLFHSAGFRRDQIVPNLRGKIFFVSLFSILYSLFSVVGAQASELETQGTSVGLSIATGGGKTLESVIGEVSGSSMAAASKGLYSGHSRTSHSPGVVYDLALSTVADTEVRLEWTSVGRDGDIGQASYVEVKIATFPVTYANYSTINSSVTFDSLSAGTFNQSLYSNLESGKTYYVAVRVRDDANMYGRLSANGTFTTKAIKPKSPTVAGVLEGNNFTLSWSAVTLDVAGSTIAVKNYEVYSSTSVTGTISSAITLSSSTLSYIAPSSPSNWYFVKTLDSDDVRSDASIWLKNSDEVIRTVADDSKAVVDVSPEVNDYLSAQGLSLAIVTQPEYVTGTIFSAYKVYLKDANDNEVVGRDLRENATVTFPVSQDGSISINSFSPSASFTVYDYAVYYFNGVEDVKIGGTVNPNSGTISASTKKTGVFKVKRVIRAQGFSITQTVPRKIFTPNNDGTWDEFHIIFENPEGLAITNAKVYDLRGTEVAKLVNGTYSSNASLMWDGKKGGSVAKSGIYIYQFKAGNKHYNGTMVLAK